MSNYLYQKYWMHKDLEKLLHNSIGFLWNFIKYPQLE